MHRPEVGSQQQKHEGEGAAQERGAHHGQIAPAFAQRAGQRALADRGHYRDCLHNPAHLLGVEAESLHPVQPEDLLKVRQAEARQRGKEEQDAERIERP